MYLPAMFTETGRTRSVSRSKDQSCVHKLACSLSGTLHNNFQYVPVIIFKPAHHRAIQDKKHNRTLIWI